MSAHTDESSSAAADRAAEIARACAAVIVPNEPLFEQFGITLLAVGPGMARLAMTIRPDMLNQQAVCHGGVLFLLADSALGVACNSHDERTLASGCAIDFLRAARAGDELIATAQEQQRGRRAGLYDVRIETREGVLIALLRGRTMTVGGTILPPRP